MTNEPLTTIDGRAAVATQPIAHADGRMPPSASRSRLLRNAVWLLGSTAITSVFGLVFWSTATHLYPVGEIGNATSLISAVSLLAYLSLFGLNSSLVRFLPVANQPDREISAAITLTGGVGLALGLGYVALLPLLAPRTAHDFRGPAVWLLFGVIVMAAAVNLVTDSVFIAFRAAHWNPFVDGVVQGVTKLLALALLVAAGTIGIFTSYGLGSVAAAVCSIWLFGRILKLHIRPTVNFGALRRYASFSAASYVSSLFNLAPLLVLPLITLDSLGSKSAGFYYVAFQISNLLAAIPFAVCESLFAEVSHAPHELRRMARRSAAIIAAVLLPVTAAVAVSAHLVLSVFGAQYADRASALLRLLCLAALPVALNTWASFLLRARRRMGWLIVSNVFYLLVAAGLASQLVHHGLVGIGWAWIAANGVSAAIALAGLRRSVSARQRMRG